MLVETNNTLWLDSLPLRGSIRRRRVPGSSPAFRVGRGTSATTCSSPSPRCKPERRWRNRGPRGGPRPARSLYERCVILIRSSSPFLICFVFGFCYVNKELQGKQWMSVSHEWLFGYEWNWVWSITFWVVRLRNAFLSARLSFAPFSRNMYGESFALEQTRVISR